MKKIQYLHNLDDDTWEKITNEMPWWAYLIWRVADWITDKSIDVQRWAEDTHTTTDTRRVKKPKGW